MKKIWIINHYAFKSFFNRGGRHYWLARRLQDLGYDVNIFCSNIEHSGERKVETDGHITKITDGIKFTFVSSNEYSSNGLDRVKNMHSFYRNLQKVKKDFEKPDIIIASSVHLLTVLAGYKLSKFFKIPLVTEIRDLWPESLVAYGTLKENSIITRVLYRLEKYLYVKSDRIIMTWEGGKDYIENKGWVNDVHLDKIYHITNGIDLESFNANKEQYITQNEIKFDDSKFNIVYTGSVRLVNNLSLIVYVANELVSYDDIVFHIIGTGNEIDSLKNKAERMNLKNIKIWGAVSKNQIPSIISQSDLNLLHNRSTILDKYGQSQNKLFEYLAAGKPVLQTYTNKYSILRKHDAGILCSEQSVNEIKTQILKIYKNEELRQKLAKNAANAAKQYDFKVHSKKIHEIISGLL